MAAWLKRCLSFGLLGLLVSGAAVMLAAEPLRPAADPASQPVTISADPHDWPMYNRDVIGTRHNSAEKTLGRNNVARLVEKWRFPAAGAGDKVGVIHGTPVVVNGYVYFATETTPTVYKLSPDGTVKWSYRPSAHDRKPSPALLSFGLPTAGFINSPLVTNDAVFVGDLAGTIYALERATGKERWRIDSRAKPFPGAHTSNCIFAAPILAEGKVVVAGGGFEHAAAANPFHPCCTGRGFVAALEPRTGRVVWKYDVGPTPQKLDPPVRIKDAYGEHVFRYGPSTSSVWCTPSYDAAGRIIFFGTDAHNSPRQPTRDDSRLYTKHSCAVIAVDAGSGAEKWVTQLNPDDIWNYTLRGYDPSTGRYKDQSIGDTPKVYSIDVAGKQTKVVGVGCKNGGFYVLDAATGKVLQHTPVYDGPPTLEPAKLDPRTLALPGAMGGLQTGCATDGRSVFTNGTDLLGLNTAADPRERFQPPTGGRVVSISLDTRRENWRHERPKVAAVGGTRAKPAFTHVGDPVASGLALANGVVYFTTTVSNRLVALDSSASKSLKEIDLGPVWCGPSVSRGRVYVGTGNLLFAPSEPKEAYFPKSATGTLYSFGLPGEDEVCGIGAGDE